jgi:hypothetical protein
MEEELTDYIRLVKNIPEQRDAQSEEFVNEIVTIHDDCFENGINGFNTTINTLLLSFFERMSYLDITRKSYDTYLRYASFLKNVKTKRENDYDANASKEEEDQQKGAYSMISILASVASSIENPSFRIYLILLAVSIFKDEGTITKKQKSYLDELFKALQIAG